MRPTWLNRISASMEHLQDIAHIIIDVLLKIGAHSVTITRLQYTAAHCVIVTQGDKSLSLAQVFTPARCNQAIDGVIGVIGARLNAAILEVDRLLGVILDMRNIALWIVGIAQIL